jgi:hypothetical protein
VINGNGNHDQRVTYNEVRRWARWLGVFTYEELADALHVHPEVGRRMVKALIYHGICEDTGDLLPALEGDGEIAVIEYIPIPWRIWPRDKRPPEWKSTPGCYELAPVRGLPVRIRSDKKHGRQMAQGSGGGRLRLLNAEKRYQAQVQAREKRAAEQKAKQAKPAKHERKKGARFTMEHVK